MQYNLHSQRCKIASYDNCPLCGKGMPLVRMQFHINTEHPEDFDRLLRLKQELEQSKSTAVADSESMQGNLHRRLSDCPVCAERIPSARLQSHIKTEHPDDVDRLEKMHWRRVAGMSNPDTAGSSFGDCPVCAESMPLARLQFHVNTEHPEDADRLQDKMHWQRYSGMSNRDTAGSSFVDCPLCAKNMPLACVQFHITEKHPEIDISDSGIDSDSDISVYGDSADDSE